MLFRVDSCIIHGHLTILVCNDFRMHSRSLVPLESTSGSKGLLRTRNAIILGDPKELTVTIFFVSMASDFRSLRMVCNDFRMHSKFVVPLETTFGSKGLLRTRNAIILGDPTCAMT